MRLGIMQPYFFPYLGYYSLIKHTDKFILMDNVQFMRHGWIERNRILKPGNEDWQYIKVPLQKHSKNTLIKDILIRNDEDWQLIILKQLDYYKKYYKKKAPFYNQIINFLSNCFEHKFESITELNEFLIKKVCEYLEIQLDLSIFSDMNLKIDDVNEADEWALNICRAMNASHYINPPGGIDLYDRKKYDKSNITLKFLKVKLTEYNQFVEKFIEGLSIIDVMMFNSVDEINNLLDNIEYL